MDVAETVILVAILRPQHARRGSLHPSPHFHSNSLPPSFIIPALSAPSPSLATFRVTLSSLVPLPTSFVCLCFITSPYLSTSSSSFICSPSAIRLLLPAASSPPSPMSLLLFYSRSCTFLPGCGLLEGNTRLCLTGCRNTGAHRVLQTNNKLPLFVPGNHPHTGHQ